MITIRDALAGKEVLVTAVIQPGEAETPRDKRDVVVTVGIPDERVVIRVGQFGQLHQLIASAWSAYGEMVTTAVSAVAASEPEEIGSAAPDEDATDYYSDDDF